MVETETKIQRYDSYKDSGVEWLGEIPEHWEVKPGFTILLESKEKNIGFIEKTVLSLSYGNVVIKPKEKLTGLVPESFEAYQLVKPGDIIIRPTDLQNDKTSLRTGLAKDNGIITSAYINLRVNGKNDNAFYHYYLHTIDINKVIYGLGSGLRQNISFWDFKRFPFPFPPLPEQTKIAQYLDDKTSKIDKAIGIKAQQINLLKERKQILIHKAVTRGLDDSVVLKGSGVEWIGEIPEHWEVKRLKFTSNLISEKVSSKESHLDYIGMENIESWTGQFISSDSETDGLANYFDKGDVLFGKLRPYLAKVYLAEKEGICSTEFLVYRTSKLIYSWYLNLIMLSFEFINLIDSSTYGSKMPRANSEFIGNQLIPVPPLSEQKEISAYIKTASQKTETAIGLKQREIAKLKEYKSSLINGMVTGKVRVC